MDDDLADLCRCDNMPVPHHAGWHTPAAPTEENDAHL